MEKFELYLQMIFDETLNMNEENALKKIKEIMSKNFKNFKLIEDIDFNENTNMCDIYFNFESENLYEAKLSLLKFRMNKKEIDNVEEMFEKYLVNDDFENY